MILRHRSQTDSGCGYSAATQPAGNRVAAVARSAVAAEPLRYPRHGETRRDAAEMEPAGAPRAPRPHSVRSNKLPHLRDGRRAQ